MAPNLSLVGLAMAIAIALGGLLVLGVPALWLASKFRGAKATFAVGTIDSSRANNRWSWGNTFAHAFSLSLIILLGTAYVRLNRAIDNQALLFHGLSIAVAPEANSVMAGTRLTLIRKEAETIAQEAIDRPRLFGPLQACMDGLTCLDVSAQKNPN